MLPHISYDLDGDGIVSNRDFFLSKYFDTDKNGILDAEERKVAIEAINNVRIFFCFFNRY